MALFELTKTAISRLDETTFSAQNFSERSDLQRLLKENIAVIAPGTLIIYEEFCDWDDSKRRIDLLGVDRKANLVVFELKRTEDGGHMELQAIRYAAMVSTMTFSKAVEVYTRYLRQNGSNDDAQNVLLEFLDWDTPNEEVFGQDVRIVLVSAEFSKEITTSVLWLNEHALDIRCVRLRPYVLESRTILDVQQVIPLPEADAYTIQFKKKVEENREARRAGADFSRYDLTIDGKSYTHMWKRALIFEVVAAAVSKGIAIDQIGAMIPPNKLLVVDGNLTADEFRAQASTLRGKLGASYNLRKYFCDSDDQLFHANGRTYALSNQWGLPDLEFLNALIELLPAGSVRYTEEAEEA